jgi:hypothetical protein
MDVPKAPGGRPRAYSYIRFSTPEQAKGDSLQRQTDAARAWAARHGLELDEELTFRDEGVSAANARAKGCNYQAIRYEDAEKALRVNAEAIFENAPRGQDTSELERQIQGLEYEYEELADEAEFLTDQLVTKQSAVLRQRLDRAEREMASMKGALRDRRAERDKLAGPYVLKRLAAVRDSLLAEETCVATVNKALKQAVRQIVLDAEAGTLTIRWDHAGEAAQNIPFFSRHVWDDKRDSSNDT